MQLEGIFAVIAENLLTANKECKFVRTTLLQVLSSEREKHAATETELNMKNLGLADKLKEARGELTGMLQVPPWSNVWDSFVLFRAILFTMEWKVIAVGC